MPKSRRDKVFVASKVTKKGLDLKNSHLNTLKNYMEKFENVFVFGYENMRTETLQRIREEMKPESRFLFGKNKIFQVALGKHKNQEIAPGAHKLCKHLTGQCGILFTNKSKQEILEWFKTCSSEEYARTGFRVNETISVDAGPLTQFDGSMEPFLRQLGLPTSLKMGVITLLQNYEVCAANSVLTPNQAKILKVFNYKLAEFKLIPRVFWTKGKGIEKLY